MSSYRLRAEGELLVLQLRVNRDNYQYGYQREPEWRDAKLTDIPVYDLFQSPPTERMPCPVYAGGIEG